MLKLNSTSLNKIRIHATRAYPEECCGMLLGREEEGSRRVGDVVEVANKKEENRGRRYLITPEDYQSAEEKAKAEGVQILGFYHSHPDHPAKPSQFDLDHALPWWSYLIISVESGQPASVASWRLKDDRLEFIEEAIEVEDAEFVRSSMESDEKPSRKYE
jgi:proteasome lid subunit RPN8/RPN11